MTCRLILCACLLLSLLARPVLAEDERCREVRLADVGWSDVAARSALAAGVLEALGYRATQPRADLPVALTGMRNGQIDALLGYWSPAMTPAVEPFLRAQEVVAVDPPLLAGARFTLAVPRYLYDKGLKGFADIARFEKELQGRIHGIEPGSDANAQLAALIRKGDYGLGGFRLVEASETALLAEVQRAVRTRKAIVFLGWEPHPINALLPLRYLEGGDEVFGPQQGAATVATLLARGYDARCPNVATLLRQLRLDVEQESRLMLAIQREGGRGTAGARAFLRADPSIAQPWLRGVTTFSGQDGASSVLAAFRR